MTIDELINSALEGRGGTLDGTALLAVVGVADTQEMFILNLHDFLMENMEHFIAGNDTGTMLLGVYKTEEEASMCIQSIRDTRQHSPNLIASKEWYVVIGKVTKNDLFILPLTEYLAGYLHFFLYKAETGNIVLNICDKKEAAEDAIDLIRLYIKRED